MKRMHPVVDWQAQRGATLVVVLAWRAVAAAKG